MRASSAALALLVSAVAWGQHQSPGTHAPDPSPYAGIQTRGIKALSADEIEALRAGRGMSLALPAELNGYPGPLHTLELAEQLRLTPQQKQETERLFQRMQREASALGMEVIEAETALERLFADGKADAASVRDATTKAAVLQGELRAVHLGYHIAMKNLLTPDQVAQYGKLRGYAT